MSWIICVIGWEETTQDILWNAEDFPNKGIIFHSSVYSIIIFNEEYHFVCYKIIGFKEIHFLKVIYYMVFYLVFNMLNWFYILAENDLPKTNFINKCLHRSSRYTAVHVMSKFLW